MSTEMPLAGTEAGEPLAEKEKKALVAIRRLRRQLEQLEHKQREPIAVVGLSCRFPMASGPDEFWQLLDRGVDATREVPPERWDVDAYYDPDPDAPGKVYTRRAGYLDDIETFDAAFFGISPREAEFMDPQQRLLLEEAWRALEDAGIAPAHLHGTRTGVFVGITASDYAMMIHEAGIDPGPYYVTGNTLNVAAGRLAYALRLQGPALAIDTACSSSLVAVHEACLSLRNGESDLALAAGANLLISPQSTIATCRAHMLSADGRCKAFDAAADGYARGEGCAVVVLKRLSDAQRDRDRILALIRGSAVNQDGRSSGLTVPHGPAQERVIADALRAARLAGSDVDYLEAHGTGTSLGDPIEVQAAAAVLAANRGGKAPLLVGSAKTNIGHLEAAAGIAGLIKVVLAMQHGRIPRHLHLNEPNPHIPWDELDLRVTTQPVPWPAGESRRIAGVSSFGFSGTNAHVVLEEPPDEPAPEGAAGPVRERAHRLLVLSGRTAGALHQSARAHLAWLERHEQARLADVCYTANTGRAHFEHRAALTFDSAAQLHEQLAALAAGGAAEGLHAGEVGRSRARPKVAFLFTGQGAQYPGMGRRLYDTEPVYREHFDRCAVELARRRGGGPDLREIVFEEEHRDLLDQTAYTQPALYALEASLAALWRSWGVEPDIVLGHSVGEYAASYSAGVFELEVGLGLIAERARLMQSLPSGGAMAAIRGPAEAIEACVREAEGVGIAAFNGVNTVVSGPQAAIDEALQRLTAEGFRCTRLKTSHAFHSALMDPILEPFRHYAAEVEYRPLQLKLVSNVSGEIMAPGTTPGASYWAEHIRRPVRFAEGVAALTSLGCGVVLEVGPHPVLTTMARQGQAASGSDEGDAVERLWIRSLRREHDDEAEMLGAAAALFVGGVEPEFAAMEGEALAARRRVSLPTYPFERRRHWVEIPKSARPRAGPKLADCVLRTVWERKDAPRATPPDEAPGAWLILSDEGGTGAAVRRRLESQGRRCVSLQAEDAPTVDALAERIRSAEEELGAPFRQVLHLWSLDRARADSVEELQQAQERGVESVLALVQALIRRNWEGRLWLVTRGVQRVLESDAIEPAQSPVWGMGKVIGMEQPRLWGGLLDLPPAADAASIAGALITACTAADAEDQVALRDGHRWVARLVRDERPALAPLKVEEDGAYLITGGLGAIGLQAARRLAERGARHLVLSNRSEPSEQTRGAIGEIRDRGCEVTLIPADVSREDDVQRLFDEMTRLRLPPLRGVIHAAGVEAITALEDLDGDRLRATMAAKVFGAWLLERITRERGVELSFFVCTSSIASVWGSVMQGAYAAANAFLDALSERRVSQGRAATALNYGPWAQAGTGMASEEGQAWLRSRGIRPLKPALALDALEAAASAGVSGTTVADVDWSKFRTLAEMHRPRPLLEYLGAATQSDDAKERTDSPSSSLIEELRAAPAAERTPRLAEAVRGEVAQILRVDPVQLDDDVSFFTLGMDSLMAVEATNRLKRRLGSAALPPQLVYEKPSVGELAIALTESLSLEQASPQPAPDAELPDAGQETGDTVEWPASIGQARTWFLQQLAPASPQFNLPVAVRFDKGIRPQLLERVLGEIVRRHDALRTTFENRHGELVQIVHKGLVPVLRVLDLSGLSDTEARLREVQEAEARELFDLEQGPPVRFTLVNIDPPRQVLLITVHHAVSDGVSLRVLLDECLMLLEAFGEGRKSPLPRPQAQFGAYAVHERRRLESRTVQDDVAYWREELDRIPTLELPSDRPRPPVQTHAGDSVPIVLSKEIRDRVHECSRRAGVTPFVTLLAAWSLLLSRYSGERDFGVGTPVAGRDGPEWASVIGFFLNMLTLRVRLDPQWTVRELLTHAETVAKRAYAHQSLPFDRLVEELNPARDPSRTPLFQSALVLQVPKHDFQARVDAAGISIEDLRPARGAAQFDVTLDLEETSTGFRGFLEYNTDLFDRWRIEQMAGHFQNLLSALTVRLDDPLSALALLSEGEQRRLLSACNGAAREYPLERCVHDRIAEQARRHPSKIAVTSRGERLTYKELNRRANRLAHYLRSRGVGPETLVGLCLDRSLDMVVGMLGVMKSGGAYVPLDPDFPAQRLELMLEDANVPVLVSESALLDRLPDVGAAVVCVDRDADRIAAESARDPEPRTAPQNPVYVIYTSGSTGKPKGVVITHRSLLNFLLSMIEETGFTSREVMAAVTTLSFDISNLEILMPLLQGACTLVATREEARDSSLLQQVLRDGNATIMQATPATWHMLRASGWTNPEGLRVLCGGEALRRDLAKDLLDVTDSLWNLYGPTETTIWSMIHRVRAADRPTVPLGRPLANTQIYILGEHLQPVPVGVPGELFIGGEGLARGYLNKPELTAERFVPDPFTQASGARLYRTGDLCQRLPDDRIEFLGRLDDQVKVRGFRIEIGDIESALAECRGVAQAAVTTWKGPDELESLAAYLVADEDRHPTLDELKASLREKLPGYMIPSRFMFLDELPLTPNKKVDRRALPPPQILRAQSDKDHVAARTATEKALVEVWKEVLGVAHVGVRDNFFDLGGHSLLIVKILTRLKQEYGFMLSVVDLYQHATVEALAEYLDRLTSGAKPAAPRAATTEASRLDERPLQHTTNEGNVYAYRRYRDGDRAGAVAAFAETFGPEPARVLDETFDWKYLDNRSAPEKDEAAVDVLECDGAIVGMDGGVHARFKIQEETTPGLWGADAHVTPDHRGVMGWVWSTSMRRNAQRNELKLSIPGAELYPMLAATESIVYLDRFVHLKSCLDLNGMLRSRGLNPVVSSALGLAFQPVSSALDRYANPRTESSIHITKIPAFDARFDELWQIASRDYPAIMVRDRAFLSWRFDRCPNRRYTRYIAEREGALVGYMVTRETRWNGALRGSIVDFLTRRGDTAAFDDLVQAVVQDFRARGCVSVTCTVSVSQSERIRRLRRHGFLYSTPGAPLVAGRGPWEERLAAIKEWYFTYADGDLDYCSVEDE